MDLLEVEQPIIMALNGPVHIHSQVPMLCDIVICTPETKISDNHIPRVLPGDGHHLVWPLMLGLNRAKYLLLTQAEISAQEAKDYGIVSEIVESDRILERATEIAHQLLEINPIALRQFRPAMMQQVKRLILDGLSMGMQAEGYAIVRKLPDTP